VQIDVIECLRR